ncbi:MAG: ribose-5-phosphate isomerase RpiA [Pseudomonadota bacterium]
MLDRLSPPDRAKLAAAYHALQFVEDGMQVGLGTGSTARWLVRLLEAERHLFGLSVEGVPTSSETEALATTLGLKVIGLDSASWLDLTIDGADEVDAELNLIKGAGGALLQEKIVAVASDRLIVIADDTKVVPGLGAAPLPVEVVRFGADVTRGIIEDLLSEQTVARRETRWRERAGARLVTDEGHYLLDLELDAIGDAHALSDELLAVPGVVETGLFLDCTDTVVIGAPSGEARFLFADDDPRSGDVEDQARFDALLSRMIEVGDGE